MIIADEMEKVVKLTLIRIGIKCDLVGFTYLSKSIQLVIEDPMKLYNLRELFNEVAKICEVKNPFRVEANIQNALTFTYNTRGMSLINDLYGMEVFPKFYKPTTAEFIKLVAEFYTMGIYKEVF